MAALDRAGGAVQFPAMTSVARKASSATYICVAGELFLPTGEGALYWERERTLIVSDLHLEKGSSYARGGQFLPPYDTSSTLALVEQLARRFRPARIISLGDSFHDGRAEERLDAVDVARLRVLTSEHDWLWVEGNHDPLPPQDLGGRGAHEFYVGQMVFRHEPTGETGEIAGHLHPVAKVAGRGKAVRRKCFVTDGDSLLMPSLGAFTGGLNVLDPAVAGCFASPAMHFVANDPAVHFVDRKSLMSDPGQNNGRRNWRL